MDRGIFKGIFNFLSLRYLAYRKNSAYAEVCGLRVLRHFIMNETRSSADADNGLDAFVGQSRSTNISGAFQVK